jgi:hypothetical protein
MTGINGAEIAGLARALVAALGGYLVARGQIDAATVEIVAGMAATLATGAWSIWEKRRAR